MRLIPYLAFVALAVGALPHGAAAEPGSAARGERMYRACVACHSLEPNRNMTGPQSRGNLESDGGIVAELPALLAGAQIGRHRLDQRHARRMDQGPAALHSGKHHDVFRHQGRAAARRSLAQRTRDTG